MSDAYDQMLTGYDDVEPTYGFSGEPLPTGWYALRVEKILDSAPSRKSGVPMVRVQLLITDKHPDTNMVGKRAWVSIVLGASTLDKNDVKRSQAEYDKATKQVQSTSKGLLSAMGVSTAAPMGSGAEKVFNFYNVAAWEGREFIGKIGLRPANKQYDESNQLQAHHALDDAKRGLEWLKAQTATSTTSTTTAPATI